MALTGLFAGLQKYEAKWTILNEAPIEKENLEEFVSAVVIEGEYGPTAKITCKDGYDIYLDMDTMNSWSKVGDTLDLEKCTIVTLAKPGKDNIFRLRG